MFNSSVIVSLIMLISTFSFTQDIEFVLNKMKLKYIDVKNVEYSTAYDLYKGHKSADAVNSYTGMVYKKGNTVYQKIKTTEFIYGEDFFIKVNNEEKTLVLDLPQKINSEIDLSIALKECKEKTMIKRDGYFSVTLKLKNTSSIPLSVIMLRINETDFTLSQMDLYYSSSVDFSTRYSKREMAQPHLKIRFKDYNFSPVEQSGWLKLDKYIETKGNILSPVKRYVGYQFIDNRI